VSAQILGKDSLTGSIDAVEISTNKLHIAQYVWDVNTLSWVKQTGAAGGVGTDVTVTNLPSTYPITFPAYSKRYDQVDETTAYLGNAVPGANESSGVWQIQRLTFTGDDVSVQWADGNANFDNNWSNRASLSYS
jgi:hypothetical protein